MLQGPTHLMSKCLDDQVSPCRDFSLFPWSFERISNQRHQHVGLREKAPSLEMYFANSVCRLHPAPTNSRWVYSQTSCSGKGSSGRSLPQGVVPRNQRLLVWAAAQRRRRWWGEGRCRAGTGGRKKEVRCVERRWGSTVPDRWGDKPWSCSPECQRRSETGKGGLCSSWEPFAWSIHPESGQGESEVAVTRPSKRKWSSVRWSGVWMSLDHLGHQWSRSTSQIPSSGAEPTLLRASVTSPQSHKGTVSLCAAATGCGGSHL